GKTVVRSKEDRSTDAQYVEPDLWDDMNAVQDLTGGTHPRAHHRSVIGFLMMGVMRLMRERLGGGDAAHR
ncbi:MAG TPA: hypothetical protein VFS39_15685, partial [Nitrospira sp.]|nr:hypothetical protein [Nitrospira sp.]